MPQYTIAVVVGSLRKDSLNRKLAHALARLAPKEFEFKHSRIDDLGLYNQDDDANQSAPVKRLKAEIRAANGVLFVTPEYNRSIPGVLKNAIDHASRPYGESAWNGKPAGIVGITPGTMGTSMAQQHLRNVLANQDMPTLAQPEAFLLAKPDFFDAEGNATGEYRAFLQKWMDKYVEFVRHHVQAAEQRKAA
jgi:chromate reductase